jgi:uncharacterized membrane protein
LADAPWSERPPSAGTAAFAGTAVAALAVLYPWVLDRVQASVGARGLALLLLAALAVSLPFRGGLRGARAAAGAGLAGLLVVAAATDDPRLLRLVPAWVYCTLAVVFAASLRAPHSIIETAARWLVPEAPPFIRDYCRVVTLLWAAFFAASAAIIGWLAFAASERAWLTYTSRTVWLVMAVLSVIEFFVRKTWFRYYFRGGPFERLWSKLFPAERTARGRRSLAYIEEYRAQLTRRAPARPGDRTTLGP